MPAQKKVDIVEELRAQIEQSVIAIAADYRGLTVTEMVTLRRAIRDAGVQLRVVKNRLFRRAAEEAKRPEMAQLAEGPTAIIFSYDDVVAPAKAIVEYMRTARNAFAMRIGVMDGQVLTTDELRDLAALPSREILAGQLAGALQGPVRQLAGLFSNILSIPPRRLLDDSVRTFGGLLEARAKQLEAA
ncbi:MAG: 50S ribosomal protein L10 [Chloroflexi bacterium]|nr:50S ribosomal protein L10 [Chloroflexota bacterium]